MPCNSPKRAFIALGLSQKMPVIRQIDQWFVEEVLPHEQVLLAAAGRMCGNGEDARDLVHDVFARVLSTDGWQAISDHRGYILRMARNIFIDRVRRSKIVEFRRILDIEDFDMPDDAPDQHRVIAGKQMVVELARALDTLPEHFRKVFIRRRIEGQSPSQMARELGVSLSTLEKRLARAVHLLTEALQPCDIGHRASTDEEPPFSARQHLASQS
ncbi:RNA polymerase sigma factor [Novosphingobium sp. P6W]|nr:RNA polymerase sigma factor [Novosphingobium sp. P6W]